MAVIDPDEVNVTLVRATQGQVVTAPAAAAVLAGQAVYLDTNGKLALATEALAVNSPQRGIALNPASMANVTISMATRGALVDLGKAALDTPAVGAPIYLSATAGAIDTAGTTAIGAVFAFWMGNQIDKILQVV